MLVFFYVIGVSLLTKYSYASNFLDFLLVGYVVISTSLLLRAQKKKKIVIVPGSIIHDITYNSDYCSKGKYSITQDYL